MPPKRLIENLRLMKRRYNYARMVDRPATSASTLKHFRHAEHFSIFVHFGALGL